MAKRTRVSVAPLIIEKHPIDYDGYPFITLIKYRDEHRLAIVDNADGSTVHAYVLDLCGPTTVEEATVIQVAAHWWEHSREKFPLSFEFSRAGLSDQVAQIYRSFSIEHITRAIGPLTSFNMMEGVSTKRRKCKLAT